jgi:hypothetical protein
MFEPFKELLLQSTKEKIGNATSVDLFFSGGMDSLAIFLTLVNLGLDFRCFTYCLDGINSRDMKYSFLICKHFGIEQRIINVPKQPKDTVIKNIRRLMTIIGSKRKTHVESMYPYLFLDMDFIRQCSVMGLEYISCTSKNSTIELYKDETPDGLRNSVIKKMNDPENEALRELNVFFGASGKTIVFPYHDKRIVDYITQFTWKQLHLPKEKMYIYESFKPTIDSLSVYRKSLNGHLEGGIRDYLMNVLECKNKFEVQKLYKELYDNNIR